MDRAHLGANRPIAPGSGPRPSVPHRQAWKVLSNEGVVHSNGPKRRSFYRELNEDFAEDHKRLIFGVDVGTRAIHLFAWCVCGSISADCVRFLGLF